MRAVFSEVLCRQTFELLDSFQHRVCFIEIEVISMDDKMCHQKMSNGTIGMILSSVVYLEKKGHRLVQNVTAYESNSYLVSFSVFGSKRKTKNIGSQPAFCTTVFFCIWHLTQSF